MHSPSSALRSAIIVVCLVATGGCDQGMEAPATQSAAPSGPEIDGESAMNLQYHWNEKSRDDLRATIRWCILGEVRLMKNDDEAILDGCRETYIDEECPESERSTFIQFAADQLSQARAQLASEQSTWPVVTDCDRLDRVESALRERGILLWQVSPCCDSCTFGELPDRIEVIDRRHPGFRDRFRGYAFFIDQTMPERLSESTELSVYLGYGWISPDNTAVAAETYKANALGIAHEVCECLRVEGIDFDWNGELDQKICVAINWQRRVRLD